MGIYKCPKHGLTGFKQLCNHAARQMESGTLMATTTVKVDSEFMREAELDWFVHLCDDCHAQWHKLSGEEEQEHFLKTMCCACVKCLDEAKGR
ncbi:MAG: hypothetical protein QM783_05585 [Phycisphaerales bacterium]